MTRLLRTVMPPEIGLDMTRIMSYVIGTLVGGVETTSAAITQAMGQLLARPNALAEALDAARVGDDERFDGYVWEALRFDPQAHYSPGTTRTATPVRDHDDRSHCVRGASASIDAMNYDALPGGDLVRQGLADLRHGEETVAALLVSIGAPRLRRIGVPVPEHTLSEPEHRLYLVLAKADSDSAHSRYNAWLGRLVSFENAAECVS